MNFRFAPPLSKSPFVPAEAGTQGPRTRPKNWVPASAGTNGIRGDASSARLALVLDLAHLGVHGHVLAPALRKPHAGLEIVTARRALRRLLHLLRPFAERIAEPGGLGLELGQAELLPDHLGALHVFLLWQR